VVDVDQVAVAGRARNALTPLTQALRRGRVRTALLGAVLTVTLGAAMLPTWHQPGSVFDEGAALAFGVRVLHGAVPHRDFEDIYGPGNAWLMAGAFAVGGTDQATERIVGGGYRLLTVLGAAILLLGVGRVPALAAGAVMVALLIPDGLAAIPAFAALGCALAALGVLARAGERRSMSVAAGFLAGAAAVMRPDIVPPLAVASLPLLIRVRSPWKAYLAGMAPAAVAYLAHAAVVGPARIGRVVSDVVHLAPARRLPVDLLGSEPGRLMLVVLVGGVAALLTAGLAWFRGDAVQRQHSRAVAALGLLTLGLAPYALSRLDYQHLIIALLPAVAAIAGVAGLTTRSARAWLATGVPVAAGGALVALLLLLAPVELRAPVASDARILLGRIPPYPSQTVGVRGRDFRLLPALAPPVQLILNAAERERRAGARTLFVGPQDLRRTSANDIYMYYLLADLRPASYYIELDPQTANRAGSGLADDLRRADVLILDHNWDGWNEPNDSRKFGSDEPNLIVSRLFCRIVHDGGYELLRRRSGVCPAITTYLK
jgi:hypothetical protein